MEKTTPTVLKAAQSIAEKIGVKVRIADVLTELYPGHYSTIMIALNILVAAVPDGHKILTIKFLQDLASSASSDNQVMYIAALRTAPFIEAVVAKTTSTNMQKAEEIVQTIGVKPCIGNVLVLLATNTSH